MYMKPDLRNILQERFRGHEADVDPGVWEAIQTQIAVPAADPIEELFRERFNGHEVAVDPSAWSAISSQIGHGAAAGTAASGGSLAGWFAAASAVVIISVGAFLYDSTEKDPSIASAQEAVPVRIEKKTITKELVTIEEIQDEQVPEQTEIVPEKTAASTSSTSIAKETSDRPKAEVDRTAQSANGNRTTSTRTIEPRVTTPATSATPADKLPEEGAAVVESVITKLAEEVHLEAQASRIPDPVGPPPVRTESTEPADRNVQTTATTELPDIFLPNTFTPNGDGINDTYRVDLDGFETMMIRIYSLADNRLVFSTDTNSEWDGAHCEKGYYLVAIEATTADGRIVTKGKAVWLNNDRY